MRMNVMKTRFFLLRHGETDWNADHNRYCGISDISLSPRGLQQASSAAEVLKGIKFDAFYSSPLQRALETARIIAKYHSLDVIENDQLLEINFGKWEGMCREEIEVQFSQSWADWLNDPTYIKAGETGETALEVYNRVRRFFQTKGAEHIGKNVLVVGHNTLNRIFLSGSTSLTFNHYRRFAQNNTGISIFDIEADEISWIQMNSMIHTIS
jgi:uncharacterized phosphatase